MESRLEFLERRRTGIGGSDVAAIVGLDPWSDALDVFLEKTRPPEVTEDENVDLMRGHLLEPLAADAYAEKTGRKIRRMPMRRHPEHQWAIVHADRQILSDDKNGTGILELKCPRSQTFRRIQEDGMFATYMLQTQWGMFVAGYDWGSIAAFNLEAGPEALLHADVAYDAALMQQVQRVTEHFWNEHVLKNVPPDPAQWRDEGERIGVLDRLPVAEEKIVTIDNADFEAAALAYADANALVKEAENARKQRKEAVTEILAELGAEAADTPAGRFYYRWQDGRRSVSRERLEKFRPLDWSAAFQHLLDEGRTADEAEELLKTWTLSTSLFEKVGEPYRTLRFYPSKKETAK